MDRLIRWGFFTALLSLLPLLAKAIFFAVGNGSRGVLNDGSLLLTNALVGIGVISEILPAEKGDARPTVNERSQTVAAGTALACALVSALLYAYATASDELSIGYGALRDISIALAIPTFVFSGALVALEKRR